MLCEIVRSFGLWLGPCYAVAQNENNNEKKNVCVYPEWAVKFDTEPADADDRYHAGFLFAHFASQSSFVQKVRAKSGKKHENVRK